MLTVCVVGVTASLHMNNSLKVEIANTLCHGVPLHGGIQMRRSLCFIVIGAIAVFWLVH